MTGIARRAALVAALAIALAVTAPLPAAPPAPAGAPADTAIPARGQVRERAIDPSAFLASRERSDSLDTAFHALPLGNSPVTGPADAPLTAVEFSDLACPYCGRLTTVLDSLGRSHPGALRVVFKHYPLDIHPQARRAARAAWAAGRQGAFFPFARRLAPYSAPGRVRYQGDSLYLALAGALGLDLARYRRDLADSAAFAPVLAADLELARSLGVHATPTLYLNGYRARHRTYAYLDSVMRKAAEPKAGMP